MERFVQSIVAGGPALVAGLWLVALGGSIPRLAGIGLALLGIVGLVRGIGSEIRYS
ncbi:hypothetical protein [Saliphagus infecundisoli]|uniref:Uncharacterized protein n=1 Tax=Saliphagus infecundisoli TaxID=1849069 RepID=A0ABD5Q9U6_9EURY|nr:hypothetical protein [Saliphagus infecundisoli]